MNFPFNHQLRLCIKKGAVDTPNSKSSCKQMRFMSNSSMISGFNLVAERQMCDGTIGLGIQVGSAQICANRCASQEITMFIFGIREPNGPCTTDNCYCHCLPDSSDGVCDNGFAAQPVAHRLYAIIQGKNYNKFYGF